MLRVVSFSLLVATAVADVSAPSASAMRLRGGGDFKEKATGIIFPENIKSGGSTLKVRKFVFLCML